LQCGQLSRASFTSPSMTRAICYIGLALLVLLSACSESRSKKFRLVSPRESGITFSNQLHETVDFNIFNYLYFYNGGGVSVGDVNGDGLLDIYFTSNQKDNKLYLNKGGFKFLDITAQAGVAGSDGWATGVTMADVNGDGRLDIYVGYLGDYLIYKGKNELFINEGNDENGIPIFSDRAREYGLDLVGFSTQAVYFDYDRDGDLDMFMLNHSVHNNGTYGKSTLRYQSHALAGDRLLRNDDGKFVDVTKTSGIYSSVLGYGLGVVVSDVNLDGWPDIYIGNDFHENDYLYINQGNGKFSEMLEQQMNHTSRYTMGVDFGDLNNDGFPDLIAMDMLPEDPQKLKASMAEDPYDVYNFKINFGYNHQFARNTLQLNNQDGTFSEIALFAGVQSTDWSWSTFFADFDLDGGKDIFVANGISKRSNDLDYINFISADSVQRKMKDAIGEKELRYIEKMPQVKIANYLFISNGDSTFTNKAKEWGIDQPSCSQGAAYGDLDNDGDLDLVINNINEEAFLYENTTLSNHKKERGDHAKVNYLKIVLHGDKGNGFGIGAKVFVYSGGQMQMQECMPTRGYQSSVDYRLTFGLGNARHADSLLVIWNDGSYQRTGKMKPNQTTTLDQQHADGKFDYSIFHKNEPLFVRSTDALSIPYRHKENQFVEFNREVLIPHMLSAEGPAVAIGDINNDGLEDICLTGSKRSANQSFIQTTEGKFQEIVQPIFKRDSVFEDTDALLFDADQDGDNDILLIAGGNEFFGKSNYRKPRLHLNDGEGIFSESDMLPEIFLNGSCAAVADIDGDDDLDIFIGARSIPWKYGIKPDSYILLNNGKGKFLDATASVARELQGFGFVKKARWTDIDNDKDPDLVIAAEWSPITVFVNNKGKLNRMSTEGSGLEQTNGWWNVIEPVDMDKDGDVDLICGNLGLNSKLKTSPDEPVRMYVDDFDKNGSVEQILSHYIMGSEYPFHTRDEMTKQMPHLKKKYLSYEKFSRATLKDIFTAEQLHHAAEFIAHTFQSCVAENLGNGKFKILPLPKAAQFSTVNSVLADDFNKDGIMDLLVAGNFYPVNIQMGRYDASYGLVLQGNGKGHFEALPAVKSGLSIREETRALKKITIRGKTYYLAVRNNESIEAFSLFK